MSAGYLDYVTVRASTPGAEYDDFQKAIFLTGRSAPAGTAVEVVLPSRRRHLLGGRLFFVQVTAPEPVRLRATSYCLRANGAWVRGTGALPVPEDQVPAPVRALVGKE